MIISVMIPKGGTGKTTTVINLAAAFANKGKKTLVVDLDPQPSATEILGVNIDQTKYFISTLMADPSIDQRMAILETTFGFDLIPSNKELEEIEAGMFDMNPSVNVLDQIISPLDKIYDYILLDTHPSFAPIVNHSLLFASAVLIPTQLHPMAIKCLTTVFSHISKAKEYNPNLKILGILPTFAQLYTKLGERAEFNLKKMYKDYILDVSIPYSIQLPYAGTQNFSPLVSLDPKHAASLAYSALANIIIKENGNV